LATSTWANMSGRASVSARDTRLACIAKRLPIALFVTEVGGLLDASVSVERPVGQRFVSVKSLDVRTRGLKIAGPQMFGDEKPRWESRSMDVAVTASVDGATGATAGKVILSDTAVLAELLANVDLDLRTLVDDPKRRLDSLAQSRGKLTFTMPRRSVQSLRSLPSIVHDKLPPFEGDFAVTVTGKGTPRDPAMSAHVSAWRWAHVDEKGLPTEWSLPIDADVVANYDAKKAGLVAQVRRNGREIVSVVGDAMADVPGLLRGDDVPTNFDVQTTLTRLPIGRLPRVAALGVDANVSGTIQLAQHGDERTAKARLFVPAVRINREASLERAAVSLDIVPSTDAKAPSHGKVEIELAGKEGGRIDVQAYAGVDWDQFVPKIDDLTAAGLAIVAHDFRLASLQPMVAGFFSRLDGRLDGHVHVASTMYGDETQGHVEANMELTDGVVHIPQIGQELRNARFSLRSPQRGALHLEDVQADGISGRIRGSAVAKMKGLSLQGVTADFSIDKGEALPITFEGVPLGNAYGKIGIVGDKRPQEMYVTVKIPELHLALPASSSRNVQSLEPHPDVMISHAVGPKKEARASGALAWIASIELGTVHIEGTGIDVKLTSPKVAAPRIELRQETRVSGDVQIVSGTFEIIGKKFEFERGLVRLREEEAGNPYVNVTARWDAPNGTRIYVDYTGVLKPITEQKLKFRSDPALPQQSILSMILTGETPDHSNDTPTEGSASAADLAANVVGGEIVSTQINAVLSQIAPLRGLSTRIGTSDSGRLRTTVMYELGDTVTAQASYEGIPSDSRFEGIRTDDAADGSNRTEINIDWRFYRNWSLRGSFGFGGGANQQPSSGLDALWQYRY
jgi:translocation and assembly module TamB